MKTPKKCQCGCGGNVGGRCGATRPGTNAFLHGHNRRRGITPQERFETRVDKTPSHWLWTGIIDTSSGYGKLDGDYAHRISWRMANGPIPSGRYIDHVCRVRECVNPAHLRVVTPAQNALENNDGPMAINARKDRCVNGHPFSKENTGHYRPDPGHVYRYCRECNRLRCKHRYDRLRASRKRG